MTTPTNKVTSLATVTKQEALEAWENVALYAIAHVGSFSHHEEFLLVQEQLKTIRDYIDNVDDKSQQGGWMPIETAPKDGSEILGYLFEDYSPQPIYWAEGALGWYSDVTCKYVSPTHWMPLPNLPEQDSENQETNTPLRDESEE